MYIVELCEGGGEEKSVEEHISGGDQSVAVFETKRVLVGAGARALFYPTLLYNVVRNKIQSEFRWWDRVDEFILLGAVPFPADVQRLKELGVHGVVTLNEPYETLVSTSLYHAHDIKHLVIPTRDYLFAPSYGDICQAVEFIYNNASCGKTTYVHCKAGRGRSTTVVVCYLVEHKQMTPIVAYEYVRSIRPRVRLALSQWQAVQDYYQCRMERCTCTKSSPDTKLSCLEMPSLVAFDDNSMVLVSKSDIEGYEMSLNSDVACNMLTELGVACRVQLTSQAAIARLSCTWLRVHGHKLWRKKLESSVRNDKPAVSDSICKSAEFTYPCMKIGQSLVLFSLLNVSFLAFFLLKFGREMGEEGMLLLSNQEGSDEYFRSTKLALKLTCRCCLTESYCEAS